MKKSLFAIAAVTAFAGAAQAQSSVTVYGVLDAGYVGGNERASGTAVNKGTWSALQTSGAESSNRLGFKGSEDLGGGNSAIFTVETSLSASTDAWAPTFRQAFGGLKKNGVGQVRIGTQNSLIWQAAAATTTGQLNNIVGSVLNPSVVSAGPASVGNSTQANNGNFNPAFVNRTSRTLQLESERFAGFVVKAMAVLNNSNTTQTNNTGASLGYTGGENNQNGWGLGADYVWNKLNVQAAYQSFDATNPYTATQAQINAGTGYTTGTPTPLAGNGFTSAAVGTNVKDNQTYVAATYNFGILKAYAGWTNRSVTSQQVSSVYLKRSAQEIGVRSFITPTIEAWASVGNGRYQAYGNGEPTANITGYQIGGNYLLSKRTNLYAIFGSTGTSNASSTTVTDSSNLNNYAVGMRHTF
jgi:predicted porin